MEETNVVVTALSGWIWFIGAMIAVSMFPITFAHTCWRVNNTRLSKKQRRYVVKPEPTWYRVLATLPFGNLVATYYSFHRKTSWVAPAMIVSAVCILLRPIYWFTPPIVEAGTYNPALEWIGFATYPLLMIGLVIAQISYIVVYMQIASWYRFGTIFKILLIIAPWAAVAYMITQLPKQDKERTTKSNDRFTENY